MSQQTESRYAVLKPDQLRYGSYRHAMAHTACRHSEATTAEKEFAATPYGKVGYRIDWNWLAKNGYVAFE